MVWGRHAVVIVLLACACSRNEPLSRQSPREDGGAGAHDLDAECRSDARAGAHACGAPLPDLDAGPGAGSPACDAAMPDPCDPIACDAATADSCDPRACDAAVDPCDPIACDAAPADSCDPGACDAATPDPCDPRVCDAATADPCAPADGARDFDACPDPPADAAPADSGTGDAGLPSADAAGDDAGPPTCKVTLCIAGAVTRDDGANPTFVQLCDMLEGTVQDCSNGQCFNTFTFLETTAATTAFFDALDTNHDGRVDDADTPCETRLAGYSWGGADVFAVAQSFLTDQRVAPSRAHIDRMVAIDPYSPLASAPLDVADGVDRFWEYRHSESPADDCSAQSPLGPYRGIPPRCGTASRCADYDYSLSPAQSFDNGVPGSDVGHCTVVEAAFLEVLANLDTGTDGPNLPATVPVQTR